MQSSSQNSHQRMKQLNRTKVLSLLARRTMISRVEIASLCNLTKQTVSNIINELLAKSLVKEVKIQSSLSVGRPTTLLRLQREELYSIGVEVNSKFIHGILLDLASNTIQEYDCILDPSIMETEGQGKYVIEQIKVAIDQLIQFKLIDGVFVGIGVGIQGIVDSTQGNVIFARKLGIFDVPLREILEKEYNCSVIIDNNIRAFASGEVWQRIENRFDHVLCIYLDQGIGGAILINGQLYTGENWQSAKIGHYTVVRGGNLCHCGKRGCLETYMSIQPLLAEAGLQNNDFELFIEQLREGKHADILNKAGDMLGFTIGNALNLLNPNTVIIGGKLTMARQWFESVMLKSISETTSIPNDQTPILFSEYNRNNPSIGAASLAFYEWVYKPGTTMFAEER